MTQGFKPLKRPGIATGKRKDKGSAAAKPKVGKRIAPKKQTALQEAIQKRVCIRYTDHGEKHRIVYNPYREGDGWPRSKRAPYHHALPGK